MIKLASVLRNIKYTRKVDLQHNSIAEVTNEFITSLESNLQVLTIDLRNNPGAQPEHLDQISKICLRNCELARKHQTPVNSEWLCAGVLGLEPKDFQTVLS